MLFEKVDVPNGLRTANVQPILKKRNQTKSNGWKVIDRTMMDNIKANSYLNVWIGELQPIPTKGNQTKPDQISIILSILKATGWMLINRKNNIEDNSYLNV